MSTMSEKQRLLSLERYDLFATDPELHFDNLTAFCAKLLDFPICLITIIGEKEQWLKSRYGLNVTKASRDIAFCDHTIRSNEVLIVEDATTDPRYKDNPLVTGPPCICFYAGTPLSGHDGKIIGALCIIDQIPRSLNADQSDILIRLGSVVSSMFDDRRLSTEEHKNNRLHLKKMGEKTECLEKSIVIERRKWERMLRIVNAVSPLVYQLRMLALNANIEAARLGDNGQAFIAISKDIKRLSDMAHAMMIRDLE
jgi:hypothetical protein